MNKSAIIAVILLVAVAGGIFAFTRFAKKDSSAPTLQNNPQITQPQTPPQAENPPPSAQSYTPAQVAEHGTESDCWMAIDGKVYDVTKFIPTHPGGKAILNGCGKDATTLFNQRPTNNRGPHPAQAKALLPAYEIGILVP